MKPHRYRCASVERLEITIATAIHNRVEEIGTRTANHIMRSKLRSMAGQDLYRVKTGRFATKIGLKRMLAAAEALGIRVKAFELEAAPSKTKFDNDGPPVVFCRRGKLQSLKLIRCKWLPAEDAILRKFYLAEGHKRCAARLPGRTVVAVQVRASHLKVHIRAPWLPAEDAILRKFYPAEGRYRCAARLPGHTVSSTQARASRLRVRCKKWRTAWLPAEDAILRKFYPAEGHERCAARLPGRTVNAIQLRAERLNVRRRKSGAA